MEQTSHKSISIDAIQPNDQLLSEREHGINNLHKGVQNIRTISRYVYVSFRSRDN